MSTKIEINLLGFKELNLKQKVDQIIQSMRLANVEQEKKEAVEKKAIEKAKAVAAKKGNLPAQQAKGKTKGSSNIAAIQAKKAGATVAGNRYIPPVTGREQVPATTKPTCIGPTIFVTFSTARFKDTFTLVLDILLNPPGTPPRKSLGPLRARVFSTQVVAIDSNGYLLVPQPENLPSLAFEGVVAEPWEEELPPPPDRFFMGTFEIEYALLDFPVLGSQQRYVMDIAMSVSGGFCKHVVTNTAQAIFAPPRRVILIELEWISGQDYDLNVGFNQSIENVNGYNITGTSADDFLDNYVGWYTRDRNNYSINNFIFHSGDNTAEGGQEYVVVDLTRNRENMPSWAEEFVTLELRSYCFEALGLEGLKLTAYPVELDFYQPDFNPSDMMNEITRLKTLGITNKKEFIFFTSFLDDDGNLGSLIGTIPIDFTKLSWKLEERDFLKYGLNP